MSLKEIRTLLLEDDVYKAMDVRRALQYCGIREIHCVTNQEEGFSYIYQCEKEGKPVQLIVTDMHYPLSLHTEADTEAGFKLLERLEQEDRTIPVIICSSSNIKETKALGCVWYSLLRDLNFEFYEILKNFK